MLWGKIIALLVVCGCCLSAQAKYSGGSGEPNDPYQITSVADWQELMATPTDWASHFVLTADIDLNDVPITPVGNDANNFTGVFDGNDHKVWNFTWNSTGRHYIGLFSYVGKTGQIKNLGMENVDVNAVNGNYVGGLVVWNEGTITNCYSTGSVSGGGGVGGLVGFNSGTITNCYSRGSITGGTGYFYVGGLVGWNKGTITNCYSRGRVTGYGHVGGLVGGNEGTITNCYSTGSVTGIEDVGGLVGLSNGTITNCYSTGSVTGKYWDVGGLVGYNKEGTIISCYSTGSVSGNWEVGGFVGSNWGTITNCYSTSSVSGDYLIGGLVGDSDGTITNCYATGSVSGTDYVGGLVGRNYRPITNSFWDIQTSGQTTSAGGTGKTTAQMKTKSTFTGAGWDFVEIWGIGENQTYPFLRTEPAGDSNHDKKVDLIDLAILASHWLEGPP
jgi:hypothetical protein